MKDVVSCLLLSSALCAQEPNSTALTQSLGDLRKAIQDGSLDRASSLADDLDLKVQAAHNAWRVRDSDSIVDTVLGWLPPETDSIWVNRAPFSLSATDSADSLYYRPAIQYSADRLLALNWLPILAGRTIRIVVAASVKEGANRSGMTPPPASPNQEVAYFYFLERALEPPRDAAGSIDGKPYWVATAQVFDFDRVTPGSEPPQRDDPHWIVQLKPDLLLLANRESVVRGILDRMGKKSPTRALPPNLVEWNQVDRRASLWGLRHYSAASKPKEGTHGYEKAQLLDPDGRAQGVAIAFDEATHVIEIRFLSEADIERRGLDSGSEIDKVSPGVWRIRANVRERGAYPFGIAMGMLGFGGYR